MGGSASGGMNWGPQDDNESVDTIITAINKGINWLDKAAAYGRGHAEEVVDVALKKLSKRPIITTKFGTTWDKDGKPAFRLDKADVYAQMDRLQPIHPIACMEPPYSMIERRIEKEINRILLLAY